MHTNFYCNKKESQVKKSKETSFYCKFHNFDLRGSSHLVNVNSKHVRAQINSRRRVKAREKSVERKRPVRTFDDETHLTSRELLQVIKNKEVKEFKNAQSKERSTGRFNPHKAKKIFPNLAQKEAEKYFYAEKSITIPKNSRKSRREGIFFIIVISRETVQSMTSYFNHALHIIDFLVDSKRKHKNSTNSMQDRATTEYQNEKKSQAKKSLTSYYRISHNFSIRGSVHIVNINSKHVQAQINSRRRIKAREKSVELKLPVRTFDDETRLTASELLQVLKNKEVRWFKNKNGPEEHSSYLSEPFNPHKAKKIFSNAAQKEAEKYFVKVVKEKFRSLKTSKAVDVLSIREEAIEKVFAKFKNHESIKSIVVYVKNLWITFDEHLYSSMSMKEKVDRHIDLIIKNTSEEREEKLLAGGATPEKVYQIFRTVQGYNLYQISLLSKRGGASLEIYVRKELERRLKLLFNRFKDRMIRIGVDTEKDFFLIARRHVSFLFNKKYVQSRRRVLRELRHILSCIRENPFDVLKDYDKLCNLQGP